MKLDDIFIIPKGYSVKSNGGRIETFIPRDEEGIGIFYCKMFDGSSEELFRDDVKNGIGYAMNKAEAILSCWKDRAEK